MLARLCVYLFWIACAVVMLSGISGCASTVSPQDRVQQGVISVLDLLLTR